MVILHESGRTYRVWMRGGYQHIRTEAALRALVASGLAQHRLLAHTAYTDALEQKSIMEILSIFGWISKSKRI